MHHYTLNLYKNVLQGNKLVATKNGEKSFKYMYATGKSGQFKNWDSAW